MGQSRRNGTRENPQDREPAFAEAEGANEQKQEATSSLQRSEVISRFLEIPDRLAAEVRAEKRKTVVTAISAQIAVAIAILQVAPIRIQNLASLDLNENFSDQGGRLFLRFDGTAMKNGRDFLSELPDHVADLIAWYCREHRPLLLDNPTSALFPGE